MDWKIRVLVLDAYGTLFDPYSVAAVCEQAFPNHGARFSHLWRAKQLEYTWLRSLMEHYEDFWQITESAFVFACKALSLQCDEATRHRLMEAYLEIEPYPEVRKALGALTAYPLAILSNGTPRMLLAAILKAKLGSFFSDVISADETRIYKPSPRVYKLATDRLGVDRSAIGFVSSNCWDVIGAKAFGFWTCWVDRSEAPPDQLGYTADRTIHQLTELPDALSVN